MSIEGSTEVAELVTQPIPTEGRSTASLDIDLLSTIEILRLINSEDARVPQLVRAELPLLADVVDRAVDAIRAGGRVHYFGAGTSGRFGVLDAAEIPPTYGAEPDLFVAHLAGGPAAMTSAIEGAEDGQDAGALEATASLQPADVVVGLAASGRTPYVAGALRAARDMGAFTVVITSNPGAPLAKLADRHICVDTGPEVVTGSTRMKAGTAQKVILHSLSTALMIRLGRTFSNLMVDVVPHNAKLRARVVRMLCQAVGSDPETAAAALDACDGDTKLALVCLLSGRPAAEAERALASKSRSVRAAVGVLTAPAGPSRHLDAAPAQAPAAHVGIDIGASGLRLALHQGGSASGDRIAHATSNARPSIGPHGLDLSTVLDAIAREAKTLPQLASHHPRLVSIGVGVAGGCFFSHELGRVCAQIAAIFRADHVACFSDSVGAHVAAIGLQAGAVLAAGTGAVATATDGASTWRQVDGYGHLLGDVGSGAWIGRRGLRLAIEHLAGRGTGSATLAQALVADHGDVTQLVRHLYASADRSAILASFAPHVFAAADQGDIAATTVVRRAAAALATTLTDAARGLTTKVAIVGGLINGSTLLRDTLLQQLAIANLTVVAPLSEPVDGAALVGAASAANVLPEAIHRQLTVRSTKGLG